MREQKNKIFALIIILIFIITVFVIHTPEESVEGRINSIVEIFSFKEETDIKREFSNFLKPLSSKEKTIIFENLPFEIIKDNREWLINFLDEKIPEWKKIDCFNTTYLMTEVDLVEKQNMKVIKNLKTMDLKAEYKDFEKVLSDVYLVSEKNWKIKKGDFYVVDETFKGNITVVNGVSKIISFEIQLFLIDTGYKFDVFYKDGNLTIKPVDEKYNDNGAYEFSEKLNFYEYKRILEYINKNTAFKHKNVKVEFSDFYVNDNLEDGRKENISKNYLDLLYNKKYISILKELGKNKYVGTLKYIPLSDVHVEDEIEIKEKNKQKFNADQNSSLIVNLFKATH